MHIILVLQTYEQLLSAIKKREFAPVYLLSGTTSFFIDRLAEALQNALSTPESEAFDTTIFYGKDTQAQTIIEAAKRYPMIAEKQFILVREAQHLNKQFEQLAPYVAQPQPQTVLVFCYKYKKFDKRQKFYKAVIKHGVFYEAQPLYDNQIEPWILSTAKTMGIHLEAQSAAVLNFNVGGDLERLYSDMEKLKLLAGTATITSEMVAQHIGFSKTYNNFELVNALAEKNFTQAMHIALHMGQNPKQHPLVVTLSTVFSFFQRLLLFHSLADKSQAASVLGIKPFFVRQYTAASRLYTMRQCSAAVALLADADVKSKGVGGDASQPDGILKELLLGLMRL